MGDRYPQPDGRAVYVRMELTRLGADAYERMVFNWPLSRLFVYFEESRIRAAYDDLNSL